MVITKLMSLDWNEKDAKDQLKRQIKFGRAHCEHEGCGEKLGKDAAIVKILDDEGAYRIAGYCEVHARQRAFDDDGYSDELKNAIAALQDCTPEERHYLVNLLKKIHKGEQFGRNGCQTCIDGDEIGRGTIDLPMMDTITNPKLWRVLANRLGGLFGSSEDQSWKDDDLSLWEGVRVRIEISPSDRDRSDAHGTSDE